MLQKGIVPPQVGMPHGLNPNVQVHLQDNSSIVIPTEAIEFRGVAGKPKRILINNFDAAASSLPPHTLVMFMLTTDISRVATHAYSSKSTSKIRLDRRELTLDRLM
jgi:hypothetical protein